MTKRDLYGAYRFWVEIDSLTEGAFSECTGLSAETEIFEWEEGGWNSHKHRLPVRTKFPNLVLKRGVATADLWQWYAEVIQGTIKRRSLSVVLYGYAGQAPLRWKFVEALPVKWVGPNLKTGASEAAVETLEIAHHGFTQG